MKVRVRKYSLLGVVFLSLILMTGCGTLETLVKKDGASTPLADWIGSTGDKETTIPASTATGEGKVVALYYPDPSGKYLLKEERTLPKTVSLARETVVQWLKGPSGNDLLASVSTTTTLRDIAIKDSVVIVDLSKEFLQPNSKVAPEIALYGLVNTLTQFSTIKQVQIRVDGQPISKYGTIDASNLVYKANLVKSEVSGKAVTPNTGTGNSGLGIVVPDYNNSGNDSTNSSNNSSNKNSNNESKNNGALKDSPSSINLFNYPPSST
ncbi:spore gernimation protein [Desulfosporosinus sp. HMP52]|uniref:GerMN domain-containing protein n=1 Tax=Desulfosporosinus sp. HMP52 TaxID=1487923 RepID=UPI00051FDA1D|nr:GerMN domain-containing protein [Desulfosporosinus sp. HMP52]KGK91544.1 spore gernimation protein [Desulfosporosinus sp. HMP52]